jgi:hypothetical protein
MNPFQPIMRPSIAYAPESVEGFFCGLRMYGDLGQFAQANLGAVSTERSERAVYSARPSGGYFIAALSPSMSSEILFKALAWSCRACTSSS